MTELWRLSGVELAEAVRAKRASAREVVQAHLDRIAEVNPTVNAATRVLGEPALDAADDIDRAIAAGEAVGPLAGVPMVVKENIDVLGSPTTHGLRSLAESYPPVDAPHIARLRAAGAIPIARTNLPDLAMRWHTDNALHGTTRNPWDAGRTPGGSSGGEAAALAVGMAPLGNGNDLAGSIRWPSQCCGTAGLKPSQGRIPSASMMPERPLASLALQHFAVQGPMARHVRDLRAMFTVTAGASPHDPWSVPVPTELPQPEGPIRVALVSDPLGQGVEPGIATALAQATDALRDAGYLIEEREPPMLGRAVELYFQLLAGGPPATSAQTPEEMFSPGYLRFNAAGRPATKAAMGERSPYAWGERAVVARAWSEFLAETPLILSPVATMPAFPVGADEDDPEHPARWLRAARMIVVVNLLGLPSAAVPVGVADGLPQGVQIIGAKYREDLCLDAAQAIEERIGALTPIDPAW